MRASSVLLLSSLLALPLVALAQAPAPPPQGGGAHERHHGPPSPERMAEHMQRKLDLNDEQTAKVRDLMEDFAAEMKQLHDRHEQALKKILTPEQLAKFEQMREERHERRGERKRGGTPPPPPGTGSDTE